MKWVTLCSCCSPPAVSYWHVNATTNYYLSCKPESTQWVNMHHSVTLIKGLQHFSNDVKVIHRPKHRLAAYKMQGSSSSGITFVPHTSNDISCNFPTEMYTLISNGMPLKIHFSILMQQMVFNMSKHSIRHHKCMVNTPVIANSK